MIHEDNHGVIGLAASYSNAIKFLIENNWLNEKTEIVQEDDTMTTVEKDLGKDWQDTVIRWLNIARFNDYFEGLFYIHQEDVFESDW